jgi:hypothetical protein
MAALWRARRGRVGGLFLGGAAAILILEALSSDALALRTYWVHALGRFLAPVMAGLALLGSAAPGAVWGGCQGLALACSMALAVPGLGWSAADLGGVARLAALSAAAGAAAVAARRLAPLRGAGVTVLVVGLWIIGWHAIRSEHRYTIWAAAAAGNSYDLVPLNPPFTPWRIWQFLDGEAPHRVAVTAGWDGMGQNWYRYPLSGARLQNRVFYVPIRADGRVTDYQTLPDSLPECEFSAWVARLRELEVDWVVTLYPEPPEARWIRAHPELFGAVEGQAGLYRFRRQ